jgi:uncharacterized protein (TIGR02145 family)
MKEENLHSEELTFTIGNQVWMTKNLNVDKFRNGDLIPEVKKISEWERADRKRLPAWCYYDNDPLNGDRYGKLYNWHAVNDPRGLAPEDWKIPSEEEWEEMFSCIKERRAAGEKIDFINLWSGQVGNSKKSNKKKLYSDILGGYRVEEAYENLGFEKIESLCHYWTSTRVGDKDDNWAQCYNLEKDGMSGTYNSCGQGNYVRCLKV